MTQFYNQVICAAVGCGSNFQKEMNINVYQLPQEETLKPTWKQKLIQEKLPADKNKSMQFAF